MPLTQQQINQLNAASQRVAAGYGSDTDRANIDYATRTYGYSYTPQTQNNTPQTDQNDNQTDTNTPANAYGDLVTPETPEEKSLRLERERQANQYKNDAYANLSEDQIRQNVLKRFQGEIDALNRIYAEKKSAERLRAKGRLGGDIAIQARRGLIGSSFGEAQTNRVEDLNAQAEQAIADEQAFEISKIMSKVRADAATEFAEKNAAKKSGAENYLKYLEEQTVKSKTKVNDVVKKLLTLKTVDWTDEKLKEVATGLNTTVDNLKALYDESVLAKTKEENALKLDNLKTLKPGETVYDPTTGKALYSVPEAPKPYEPLTKEVGNTLLEWNPTTKTWDSVFTAPENGEELSISELLKLKEMGYEYDSTSNSLTKATETLTPQKVQGATNVISNINEILNSPGFKGAVGAKGLSGLFGLKGEPISGTAAAGTKAKIDALIAGETLKNMGLIKGVLSDSDMKILRDASSGGLSTKLKEEDFKAAINKLKAAAYSVVNHAKLQPGQVIEFTDNGEKFYSYKNNDGTVHTGKPGDNYEDYTVAGQNNAQALPGEIKVRIKATGEEGFIPQNEYDPNIYDKISFNSVAGDTNKALTTMNINGKTITVNENIRGKLALADTAFYKATGKHLQINQAYRTNEQQTELYNKLSKTGARVALPGKSFHEKGLAVDITNWKEAEPYLRKYGLKNNLADDKGHFSYGEFA